MAERYFKNRCFLLLALAAAAVCLSFSCAHAGSKKNVLVLHSYHSGYKWTDDISSGIKSVLMKDKDNISLYIEYMDTKRLSDQRYFEMLYEIYRHKFSKIQFDVIICSDDDAYNFLREHRDALFARTPVVFCGVNYFRDADLKGHDLFTGVNEAVDMKSGIDIALKLHPNTKKIVIVNDATTTGQKIHDKLNEIIPSYLDSVAFEFLEDIDMEELRERLQRLSDRTLVLYTLFLRDSSDKFFEYDESISLVAEKCKAPVYGAWDFSLGYGIVGGMLTSGYYQGETAAKIAVRILAGEKVENIPVIRKSPNRYMFDYKQLDRFNINISDLPKDSIIINKPHSPYSEYKKLFWGVVSSICFLAFIVAILSLNIMKRKRAEAELRKSRDLLSAVIKAMPIAIFSKDRQGRYRIVNDAFVEHLGLSPAGMEGKTASECWPNEEARAYHDKDMELMERDGVQTYECRLPHVAKGPRDGILTKACFHDSEGGVAGLVGSFLDITDRKRAEQALLKAHEELECKVKERTFELIKANEQLKLEAEERKQAQNALINSERRLNDIINFLPDATFVIDRQGKVIAWNQSIEDLTGIKADEILGRGDYEYAIPLYGKRRPLLLDLAMQPDNDQGEKDLYPYINKENDTLTSETFVPFLKSGVHLWFKARPLYDSDGGIVGAVESMRDVTERKRAEEAIRSSEAKMRLIIESSPIGIRIAQAGRYVYINPAFVRMFGYESMDEILGRPVESFYAPECQEVVRQHNRDRSEARETASFYEAAAFKKNGDRVDVGVWVALIDYQGQPACLAFVVDTGSEKRLRAQLLQAQKMEAIGTLAGGVAHDFNNVLQTIQWSAELLLLNRKDEDFGCLEIKEIMRSAAKAAELTQQLLTFSRKVDSKLRPVDVNHEIREVKKLLSRTSLMMIEIKLDLVEDLNVVNADPGQLEQVLMNLALNAMDAMPDGGDLVIETRNVALDEGFCRNRVGVKPGRHVLITVSDTGQGIAPDLMTRIFDPFFTTKEVGKGTGLGLAIVYGIVESHGGAILCSSEPGSGTCFKIYLPAIEVDKKAVDRKEKVLPMKGGHETILLVDDEESLRELGRLMLSQFGYSVLLASSGEQALALYQKEKDRINLVVLDLLMPGMGGSKCLEELIRINPHAKVLISSGYYYGDAQARKNIEAGAAGIIGKPYKLGQLLKVVREVLDKKPSMETRLKG